MTETHPIGTGERLAAEALARVERQFSTGRNTYEAPNGIIQYRVDCRDLAAVLKLAHAALSTLRKDEDERA